MLQLLKGDSIVAKWQLQSDKDDNCAVDKAYVIRLRCKQEWLNCGLTEGSVLLRT